MAGAGYRPSELVALNLEDVEKLSSELSSKGYSSLRAIVERYVAHDRLGLDPAEEELALFPSVGVGSGGGRLTRQGVWLIVKERAEACGLDRRVSPRSLRRSHLAVRQEL
jgi:integrase/recombinase XerD